MLIRTGGAGGTHAFLQYLTARELSYSVGFTATDAMAEAVEEIPSDMWIPALDPSGYIRDGAWVAELTGLVQLSGWPAGMRLIVCNEPPHPGAQLRFTDRNGLQLTVFVTNTSVGSLKHWSYDIAAGPVAKTTSEPPRTPAWRTCRCTDFRRMRSGWRSSLSLSS